MKNANWRVFGLLVMALLFGVCCLGATPQGGDSSKENAEVRVDNEPEGDRWQDDEDWEDEEYGEEDPDEGRELDWEVAEQSLLAQSIELTTEVAKDEVKTAVVTATLLIEHAELTTAIDTLTKAINKASSSDVKRALRLKIAEAHLDNDDPTSAIAIATQLLVGD